MSLPRPSNRPSNNETQKTDAQRFERMYENISGLWNETNDIRKKSNNDYEYLFKLIQDLRTTLYRNGIS